MKFLHRLLQQIESIPFGWAIFFLLVIQKVSPILTGGEEQYLAYAKQAIDPAWINQSFTLTEEPGSRIVFQWIVGFFLKFFSFETTAITFRLLNFAAYSIALHYIFNFLKLPRLVTFIAFELFLISRQSFFAMEWIFGGFEPKTISYAFLLFAVYTLLRQRYILATILIAAATYFHFLVAGWFFLAICISLLITRNWREFGQSLLTYIILITPLLFYLIQYIILPSQHIINDINVDAVYCYMRLPHHTAIAKSWQYFADNHLIGMINTLVTIGLLLYFKKKITFPPLLLNSCLVLLTLPLLFIPIAFIDSYLWNQYGSIFLKMYPFRSLSIGCFLALIIGLYWLKDVTISKSILSIIFILLTGLVVAQSIKNVKHSFIVSDNDTAFNLLTTHIDKKLPSNSHFALLDISHSHENEFIRKANRENLVVYKFTPATSQKIYHWQHRLGDIHNASYKKGPYILLLKAKYGVTHIVSKSEIQYNGISLIKTISPYYLYELE